MLLNQKKPLLNQTQKPIKTNKEARGASFDALGLPGAAVELPM